MTDIPLILSIEEPIQLELTVEQPIHIISEHTIQHPTLLWGAKYSALDAGTLGDMYFDDDFGYICVKTGDAGFAKWKRFALKLI